MLGLEYEEERKIAGHLCDFVIEGLDIIIEVMGPKHYVKWSNGPDLRT